MNKSYKRGDFLITKIVIWSKESEYSDEKTQEVVECALRISEIESFSTDEQYEGLDTVRVYTKSDPDSYRSVMMDFDELTNLLGNL